MMKTRETITIKPIPTKMYNPPKYKFETVPITEVKVGDVLSVNTGYRPLDDENCKVLKIRRGISPLFNEEEIGFFIESRDAGNHWYDNLIYGTKGGNNCPIERFEYKVTKVTPID